MSDKEKLEAIQYLISELDIDDVDNSIRNATRCLRGHGYLELQNMVADYYYRAGINHMINQIRNALGMEHLYLPSEKERIERDIKLANMGSLRFYDCPPLTDNEFNIVDGGAKLISLGEDGDLLVIGTTSRKEALRLMQRYQKEFEGLSGDELVSDDAIKQTKVAWRKASEEEGDFEHMFTWSEKRTANNPRAVNAFIAIF